MIDPLVQRFIDDVARFAIGVILLAIGLVGMSVAYLIFQVGRSIQ